MARQVTADELIRIFSNAPRMIRPEMLAAMKEAAALAEGQAKQNCGYVPSEDGPIKSPAIGAYLPCPYEKPPRKTGRLCRGNHGFAGITGDRIWGAVGNDVQEYNLHIHEGTAGAKRRPFLTDAVDMQQENIRQILRRGLRRGLDRVRSG